MGGIIIFIAVAVPFLILSTRNWQAMGVFGAAVACALLGFADDYTKIVRRRSLGLRARTKLGVTIAISIGLWWVATQKAHINADRPAAPRRRQHRPRAAVPAVHLPRRRRHDQRRQPDRRAGRPRRRLRGDRAARVHRDHVHHHRRQRDLTFLAACLVGACIGFLWFNSFPASIFMGDTGSLGLGGAIAGLAIMTNTEVLLILLGGIFVIEALSVLIQVFSFQTFRKRVFLMAPIHHHFELQAWSETKIILRFWIVAAAFARDRLHAVPALRSVAERTGPPAAAAAGPVPGRRAGPLGSGRGARAARPRGGGDRLSTTGAAEQPEPRRRPREGFREAGVEVHLDASGDVLAARAGTLIKSPGVPQNAPAVVAAQSAWPARARRARARLAAASQTSSSR